MQSRDLRHLPSLSKSCILPRKPVDDAGPFQNGGTDEGSSAQSLQIGGARSMNRWEAASLRGRARDPVHFILEQLGLGKLYHRFSEEEVDIDSFTMLEEADLREMGIALGPRKKIYAYICSMREEKNHHNVLATSNTQPHLHGGGAPFPSGTLPSSRASPPPALSSSSSSEGVSRDTPSPPIGGAYLYGALTVSDLPSSFGGLSSYGGSTQLIGTIDVHVESGTMLRASGGGASPSSSHTQRGGPIVGDENRLEETSPPAPQPSSTPTSHYCALSCEASATQVDALDPVNPSHIPRCDRTNSEPKASPSTNAMVTQSPKMGSSSSWVHTKASATGTTRRQLFGLTRVSSLGEMHPQDTPPGGEYKDASSTSPPSPPPSSPLRKHRSMSGSEDFLRACQLGDLDKVKSVLKRAGSKSAPGLLRESRTKEGYSGLQLACAHGHVHLVKYLLKRYYKKADASGAYPDINATDDGGWTALHSAAACREDNGRVHVVKIIKMLLRHGANALLLTFGGQSSPVHLFARLSSPPLEHKEEAEWRKAVGDVLDMMVAHGYVLDAQNENGETALHIGCMVGNTACVAALLERGAEPNALNNAGETPMHYAARMGFDALVELLAGAGGDDSIKGQYGIPSEVRMCMLEANPDALISTISSSSVSTARPASHARQHRADTHLYGRLSAGALHNALPSLQHPALDGIYAAKDGSRAIGDEGADAGEVVVHDVPFSTMMGRDILPDDASYGRATCAAGMHCKSTDPVHWVQFQHTTREDNPHHLTSIIKKAKDGPHNLSESVHLLSWGESSIRRRQDGEQGGGGAEVDQHDDDDDDDGPHSSVDDG